MAAESEAPRLPGSVQSVSFDLLDGVPQSIADFCHKGTLLKKRGGFMRNMPNQNWIARTFGLTHQGLLVYYDAPTIQEAQRAPGGLAHPRKVLDLLGSSAWFELLADNSDGPTEFMIVINHDDKRVDYGLRLKLCANTKEELDKWVQAIGAFCRRGENQSVQGQRSRGLSPTRRLSIPNGGPGGLAAQRHVPTPLRTQQSCGTPQRAEVKRAVAMGPRPGAAAVKPSGLLSVGGNAEFLLLLVGVNLCCRMLCLASNERVQMGLIVIVNMLVVAIGIQRPSPPPAVANDDDEGDGDVAAPPSIAQLDAGATVKIIESSEPPIMPSCSSGNYRDFPVRPLRYLDGEKKKYSTDPLYDLVGMDVFRTKMRVDHISTHLRFSFDLPDTRHPDIPPLLVFNVQFPYSDSAPLNSSGDGDTCTVVFYFRISPQTLRDLQEKPSKDWSAALRLLAEWCRVAPEDPTFRGRFKCMGFIDDIEKFVPSLATNYNGKPVLIKKTGTMYREDKLIEMDVNVHRFSFICRKILVGMKDKFKDMTFKVGFTIEGRDESELPEILLGCANINGINSEQGLDLHAHSHSSAEGAAAATSG